MKKIFSLLSLVLFISTTTQAQYASKASKTKLTSKDSMMCNKTWNLKLVEEWGVESTPTEQNKNDMLLLNYDNTFESTLQGKKRAGNWSKSGQYIYFTDKATSEKWSYKIISVEPKKLKADYVDPSEAHSLMTFEVK